MTLDNSAFNHRSINVYIVVFIVLLLAEVLESCLLKVIMDYRATWVSYLGPSNPVTFSSLLNDCLNFMVLYNYIVPISLYVTIGENQGFFNYSTRVLRLFLPRYLSNVCHAIRIAIPERKFEVLCLRTHYQAD